MVGLSKVKVSITTRLILVCLLMGLVPLTVAGVLGISITINTLQAKAADDLQTSAELQVRNITDHLDRVVKDVLYLTQLQSLKTFLTKEADTQEYLIQEFEDFHRVHPEYYQIRFLSFSGREIIRSNHKDDQFFRTPDDRLQYKGHRYYFQKALKIDEGGVYFSPIDLNVEHSKIEKPNRLVIRVCSPVFLDGVKQGLIVINLFANNIFEWIKLPKTPFTSFFLNEEGRILHLDKSGDPPVLKNYTGKDQHISELFPFLEKGTLNSRNAEVFSLESEILAFYPIRGIGDFYAPAWYIVSMLPKSHLDPHTNMIKRNLVMSAFVVAIFAIIFGVFLAKRFTRPIRQLYLETDLIASGNLDHELTIDTQDEIGELAEKFDRMRLQIKEKQTQLSLWNQELNEKLDWHIAELRNMERQLYRADKLASLGEVSMRLAHEIGNPLASIKTVTQAMSEDAVDGQAEYYSKIVSEVDRLNSFLKKFNNFAVMKEVEPFPCDLEGLIGDVNYFLKIEAEEHGVGIEEIIEPGIEKILIDPQQVKQILINLILNAIQACDRGGRIRISLKNIDSKCVCEMRGRGCFCKQKGVSLDGDEFVELSICDNGKGMDDEDLIKIFDPFYTTRPDGTGLGLSVAHRIVEMHHGIIRVHSKKGEGTTFRIYFPKSMAGAKISV